MTPPARMVTIEARPEKLTMGLAHGAVLVIDMQNDFAAQGGIFDRAGIDLSSIQQAVGPTRRVVAAARDAGVPIVYLKHGHRADMSDMGDPGTPHGRRRQRLSIGATVTSPDGRASRLLIEDTWNTEILPELAPKPDDIVVRKHHYSGFYETELDARLRVLGARYLIVTGCTTSVCVESTIRDAMFRDYVCLLLEDCTGQPVFPGVPVASHEASVRVIEAMFGSVSDSETFVRALGAGQDDCSS